MGKRGCPEGWFHCHLFAAVQGADLQPSEPAFDRLQSKEATMTQDLTFSRRRLLQGSAVVAGLATAPALAKGPMLGTQAPYLSRFKLGNAEAPIVSDGPLPLGDPHKNFNGLSPAEMDKQLTDNFLPLENPRAEHFGAQHRRPYGA